FPRIALVRVLGIGVSRGVFLTGDATHEPGVAAEQCVQTVERPAPVCVRRPPPGYEGTAVHARDHVTNHVRLHRSLLLESRAASAFLPAPDAWAGTGSRAHRRAPAGSWRRQQPANMSRQEPRVHTTCGAVGEFLLTMNPLFSVQCRF